MKKRSLLVATVMLLVAVLAATGTTYAWFTGNSTAKTTITMNVATGKTLEIKGDADSSSWGFNLENKDFTTLSGGSIWEDFTVIEGDLFRTKTYSVDDSGVETWGVDTSKAPVKITLNLRSTSSTDVTVKNVLTYGNASNNTTWATTLGAARVSLAVTDAESKTTYTHFSNTPGTFNSNDTKTSLTQSYKTVESGTIELTKNGNYYTATVDFYFWIDGVIASNTDIVDLTDSLLAQLSFEQIEAAA